jgi:hypothetical protein
MSKKVVEL